jgi:hypothetical protein
LRLGLHLLAPVAQKLGKIVAFTLLYLVLFDIVGVVVCLVVDVAPVRAKSTALIYVIWFVLGVFCGMLSYNTGGRIASGESKGDWTGREDAAQTGLLVVLTTSAVLVTLSIPCYLLLWRYDMESSFFVPDSAPLTLTFFVTVLASVVLAHTALRPEPKKTPGK